MGQLVLARFKDEVIVIRDGADEIRVMVVAVLPGAKVRLGIDAPKHVTVNRLEVQEDIDANGRAK